MLVIMLGERGRSTKLEDRYGKETGDGRQFRVVGKGSTWGGAKQ